MNLLAVPNWSFGRDSDLLGIFRDLLSVHDLKVHFCASDVDHNRTVTAFSGDPEVVFERIERLAEAAFERIDLNRHVGVHPRIGALDVCPFIRLDQEPYPLVTKVELFASNLATRFGLPIYLYEDSARQGHPRDLPKIRQAGFGGLLLMEDLGADFGPKRVHDRLGATVMGVRGFLIAMNVDFHGDNLDAVKRIARELREERDEERFELAGLRALGLLLRSRDRVQVSMNMSLPDLTRVDPIIERVMEMGRALGLSLAGTELIGVIRDIDLPTATRLPVQSPQIVDWGAMESN